MVGRADGDEAEVGICPAAFCWTETNAGTTGLMLESGGELLGGWVTVWLKKLPPAISLWLVHPRPQSSVIIPKPARTTVSFMALQARPTQGRMLLLSRFQRKPLGCVQAPMHPPAGQVRRPATEPE